MFEMANSLFNREHTWPVIPVSILQELGIVVKDLQIIQYVR